MSRFLRPHARRFDARTAPALDKYPDWLRGGTDWRHGCSRLSWPYRALDWLLLWRLAGQCAVVRSSPADFAVDSTHGLRPANGLGGSQPVRGSLATHTTASAPQDHALLPAEFGTAPPRRLGVSGDPTAGLIHRRHHLNDRGFRGSGQSDSPFLDDVLCILKRPPPLRHRCATLPAWPR